MSLGFYIEDTQALLHDTNGLLTSRKQLIRWINQGRTQVAKATGCIRVLVSGNSAFGAGAQPGTMIPGGIQPGALPGATPSAGFSQTSNSFQTIAGVERYPYKFANPYLRACAEGVESIVDVFDLSVSWGGVRPNLNWMPWDELQAYARSYNIGVFSYPGFWSTNGDGTSGEVWLFPVPSVTGQGQQAIGEMEWDCICIPKYIYNDSDFDALPENFQSAVKYYGAHMAYLGARQPGLSENMLAMFAQQLGISRTSSDFGKVPSYYDLDGP